MLSICRQPIFGALRDQASDVILTGIPEQQSAKTSDRRTSGQRESESMIKFFECSSLTRIYLQPFRWGHRASRKGMNIMYDDLEECLSQIDADSETINNIRDAIHVMKDVEETSLFREKCLALIEMVKPYINIFGPALNKPLDLPVTSREDAVVICLALWRASQVTRISVGSLSARNPDVYKWKSPFEAWVLREVTSWRLHDLLTQCHLLYQQDHILGFRILLRSGIETLAILIYLNQLMDKVIKEKISFNDFDENVKKLVLGSKDESTTYQALNIVGILDKCDNYYSGIKTIYADLSETAHPNYKGLVGKYSKADHDKKETNFLNRWSEINTDIHVCHMEFCIILFNREYNVIWPDLMTRLEDWIMSNNVKLECRNK